MMSENRLPVDDPRLTAYALGELDPAGCAEVERLLEGFPECREAVAEVRELAGLLTSGLKAEPAPAISDAQRAAIVQTTGAGQRAGATAGATAMESARRKAVAPEGQWARRFASLATIAAMLMVALLVVPFGRSRDSSPPTAYYSRDDVQYIPDGLYGDATSASALSELNKTHRSALASERFDVVGKMELDDTNEILFEGRHSIVPSIRVAGSEPARDASKRQEFIGADFGSENVGNSTESRTPVVSDNPNMILGDMRRSILSARKGEQTNNSSNSQVGEKKADVVTRKPNDIDDATVTHLGELRDPDKKNWKDLATRRRKLARPSDGTLAEPGKGRSPGQADEQRVAGVRERGLDISEKAKLAGLGYVGNVVVEDRDLLERDAAGGEGVENRRLILGVDVDVNIVNGDDGKLRESRLRGRWAERDEYNSTAEVYEPIVENPFVTPLAEPLSTFSVDVDTASYANVRRFVTNRQMPPRNAVRIEELINYFRYEDPQPVDGRPFSVNVEVGNAPWRPQHRLVRIGLKGREIPRDKRPTSNLVFLVDVSGSMSSENKLPLVKAGLSMLTEQMTEADRVAIVTYSDTATLRLESTTGDKRQPILDTIAALQAAGSTNGAGGIQLAYETAVRHFVEGGTNRVILCTDGDFNVGVSDDEQLVQLIQERARTKVFFSVFGFGMGNLKDGKLEKLADKGNGHYAYIDGQREAKKVFVDELSGTLVIIAKDVKLQVEFNPARVGAYRLIGYENRALAAQDFHNDKKDAGEIGAGHSVTALYEVAPANNESAKPAAEGLRYQRVGVVREGNFDGELLTVKLRYKQPEADTSELFEVPAIDPFRSASDPERTVPQSAPSRDFQWSAAVAAFGMLLRDSQFRGQAGLDLALELAQGAKGDDKNGLRQEFIDLVQTVKSMRPELASAAGRVSPPSPPASPAEGAELTRQLAERHATVDGKYKNLLRVIPAPGDAEQYGPFRDYGRWEGTSYLGHENLPQGYWVYVAPNWYIWGDATKIEDRR